MLERLLSYRVESVTFWFLIVGVRMMLLLATVKQECVTLVLVWIMILVAVLPITVMLTAIGMQ